MKISWKLLFLSLFILLQHTASVDDLEDIDTGRKPYIVYLGIAPKSRVRARDTHHSLLHAAIGDKHIARKSMIYSYLKSFNAFAARLLPEEAEKLRDMEGIVSVFPSSTRKLHTTRSWDFVGLPQTAKRNVGSESNVIVGLLDTGIWPESPSFNDKGLGPPPAKWKGKCVGGANFTGCNNKIIGARFFNVHGDVLLPPDIASPVDTEGHGTHTSSTVAGATVENANLYGLADGTARGGVPSARIAMYKVCWTSGCRDIDLLAGFDQAISDGVDIISISVGGPVGEYFGDVIAIGSFHAMKKGILTSSSAGNSGPWLASVENVAPWMLTVAASTIDRQFRTALRLGNGHKLTGISINTFSRTKKIYPLTSGALAGQSDSGFLCLNGTLEKEKVAGRVIYCDEGGYDQEDYVKSLGGIGIIKQSNGLLSDTAFASIIPSTTLDPTTGQRVAEYINSTRDPEGIIYKTRAANISAPFITSFSSRGPNTLTSSILKPDIAAPGLDILAAFTPFSSVTGDVEDNRIVKYNILSGTSMACPHASGAAAYLKSLHPHWSPSAIKSALMTTAREMMSSESTSEAEFGYGSGQIDPVRATDPGLVYDANETSYIRFLCRQGYDGSVIGIVVGSDALYCSSTDDAALGDDALNYPSMQFEVGSGKHPVSATFYRTVTNVGQVNSVYKATVRAPKGLKVTVSPSTLVFDRLNQQRSFKVVVKGGPLGESMILSASLVWSDSKHTVRSPIVIYQFQS